MSSIRDHYILPFSYLSRLPASATLEFIVTSASQLRTRKTTTIFFLATYLSLAHTFDVVATARLALGTAPLSILLHDPYGTIESFHLKRNVRLRDRIFSRPSCLQLDLRHVL